MKRLIFLVTLINLTFILSSQQAVAQSNNITSVCRSHYEQCLALLPDYLIQTELPNDTWYVYKMYQFEALFQLGYFDKLRQETAKFIDANQGTIEFQFLTLTYYAKTLFAIQNEQKGMYYLDRAKGLYNELKSSISNPIYLVNYANIMLIEAHRLRQAGNATLANRKYLEVKQLLLTVQKNYFHFNNPVFQFELYGNLSHTSAYLNHHSASIEYAKKALFWSRQHENEQQVGISQFNLARSYQQAGFYGKAKRAFIKSLDYFANANDKTSLVVTYLRLIEVSRAAGDSKDIEQYFSQIDSLSEQITMSPQHIEWLQQLRSENLNAQQ